MLARTILAGTLANLLLAATALAAPPVEEGSVLPFPPVPSASVAASLAAGIEAPAPRRGQPPAGRRARTS